MTKGMQAEQIEAKRKLAGVHGDLDAIAIIQERLNGILITTSNRVRLTNMERWGYPIQAVTFEGKKHLWNMLSRLTSRVESAIISDRGLLREVIHLAAKGRKGK